MATDPLISDPVFYTTTGGVAAAALGLLSLLIRRTISRDNTAIRGDKSESSQFSRLEAEIKTQTERAEREMRRADQAFDDRNRALLAAAEAIGKITGLEQQVLHLTNEVHRLNQIIMGRDV